MTLETLKTPNDYADFWRNDIGVNVIPANSINKIPKVKWVEWQDKPIPKELHGQWKKENMFQDGMSVICGQVFHNQSKKGLFLNMIDMDNKMAVKEFCIYDLEKFATNTLTEQHANPDKAHAYYYTSRPIQSKPPDEKDDNKPMIEVKSRGKMLSYCTPSPHKDGSNYGIVDIKKPKIVDPEYLELRIDEICKYYDLPYLSKIGKKTQSSELMKGGVRQGAIHVSIRTVALDWLFKTKNATYAEYERFMTAYNQTNELSEQEPKFSNSLKDYWNYYHESKEEEIIIESGTDLLKEAVNIISRTVKKDPNLVYHILFNGLSTFTKNPSHLMITEKTAEGKTYPALEIAQYFPRDCIIILASATPQTFKYEHGVTVNENYESIQDKIYELSDTALSKDKIVQSQAKKELKKLLSKSKTLIDLTGKWIIFKEPPNQKLLEMMYSTLSKDEEYSEHKVVPDGSRGKRETYTIVIKGTPSVLIATAKDETKSKRWMETFSRFTIISPKSSMQKYKEGMVLIGQKMGLPKVIYEEEVINKQQKQKCKQIISNLIEIIKKTNGECFNPFIDKLAEIYPHETGYRWRQRQRFDNLLLMHALCYYDERPQLLIDGRTYPIITKKDLNFAIELSKNNEVVPPHKLDWHNDIFMKAWEKNGEIIEALDATDKKVIFVKRIKDYVESETKTKTSTKEIRETFLETLYDFGLIDKEKDPRAKSRDVYWPSSNNSKTSFIVESSFDELCVRSCLEKHIKRRFEYMYKHKKISVNDLIKNVVLTPIFEPKSTNGETTINDDSKQTNGDKRRLMAIDGDE